MNKKKRALIFQGSFMFDLRSVGYDVHRSESQNRLLPEGEVLPMQNEALVPAAHYNLGELYNRIGQYCYRIGEIEKAKMLFFLANLYSGRLQLNLPA